MIPTVMYIFNSEVNIVKSYMIIILISYIVVNFMNMNYLIAKRNINRYYSVNDLDVDYLENYELDNVPLLIDLYNKTEDEKIKNELNDYLYNLKYSYEYNDYNIFEFNFTRNKALKLLNDVEVVNNYIDYSDYE